MAFFRQRLSLYDQLSKLGLTAGLKLCLDAGDSASYSSGQSWLDRSGNGYDFFRGATGAAAADDPTFNGTPGSLTASEFWSFDGADFFRYDSANETWMQNIHKDGAKYTFVAWLYPQVGVNHPVMGNNGGAGSVGVGFHFGLQSDDKVFMRAANGLPGGAFIGTSVNGVTTAAWNFIAATVDEATGFGAYQVNAAQETFTSTYASPSAASASWVTEIAARGNGNSPFPNGSRLAMLAVWEGVALTQAQINKIYATIHARAAIAPVSTISLKGRKIGRRAWNVAAVGAVAMKRTAIQQKRAAIAAASSFSPNFRRLFSRKAGAAAVSNLSATFRGPLKRFKTSIGAQSTISAVWSIRRGARLAASAVSQVGFTRTIIRLRAFATGAVSAFSARWRIIPFRVALSIVGTGAAGFTGRFMRLGRLSIAATVELLSRGKLLWDTAPQEVEPWVAASVEAETWAPAVKQAEGWASASKQEETWTPAVKQAEPWSTN